MVLGDVKESQGIVDRDVGVGGELLHAVLTVFFKVALQLPVECHQRVRNVRGECGGERLLVP